MPERFVQTSLSSNTPATFLRKMAKFCKRLLCGLVVFYCCPSHLTAQEVATTTNAQADQPSFEIKPTHLTLLNSLNDKPFISTAMFMRFFLPFEHNYKSQFSGFSAKSIRKLEKLDDNLYELSTTSKAMFAKYTEYCRFKLDKNNYPVPIYSSMKSRIFGKKRNEETHFDWETMTATWQRKDTKKTAKLEAGMLDRTLYQLLLSIDASMNKKDVTYRFINRGKVKEYTFVLEQTETIEVDSESLKSLLYKRKQDNKNKQTLIWIAPEKQFQIVKILHKDTDGVDYKMSAKFF